MVLFPKIFCLVYVIAVSVRLERVLDRGFIIVRGLMNWFNWVCFGLLIASKDLLLSDLPVALSLALRSVLAGLVSFNKWQNLS